MPQPTPHTYTKLISLSTSISLQRLTEKKHELADRWLQWSKELLAAQQVESDQNAQEHTVYFPLQNTMEVVLALFKFDNHLKEVALKKFDKAKKELVRIINEYPFEGNEILQLYEKSVEEIITLYCFNDLESSGTEENIKTPFSELIRIVSVMEGPDKNQINFGFVERSALVTPRETAYYQKYLSDQAILKYSENWKELTKHRQKKNRFNIDLIRSVLIRIPLDLEYRSTMDTKEYLNQLNTEKKRLVLNGVGVIAAALGMVTTDIIYFKKQAEQSSYLTAVRQEISKHVQKLK